MELSRIDASGGLDDRKDGARTASWGRNAGTLSRAVRFQRLVTVTFQGDLGRQNVAQMTASGAGLTGGTAPAVTVTTIVNRAGPASTSSSA